MLTLCIELIAVQQSCSPMLGLPLAEVQIDFGTGSELCRSTMSASVQGLGRVKEVSFSDDHPEAVNIAEESDRP